MALKNLAKGLALRGLIIDARVLRRLPGETLFAKSVDVLSPLAGGAPQRRACMGMRGSEIREELIQRGAPVDGEPWELEASLARLLAESGPQTAPVPPPSSMRPSAHSSLRSRVDAEARGDATFAPDTAEGSIRTKYMVTLSGRSRDPNPEPDPTPNPEPPWAYDEMECPG